MEQVICFTYEDALARNQVRINEANTALDRFVSAHPESISDRHATFRMLRQNVKELQLERNELLEMQNEHRQPRKLMKVDRSASSHRQATQVPKEARTRQNQVTEASQRTNKVNCTKKPAFVNE